MTSSSTTIIFDPYQIYLQNVEAIDDFAALTMISYRLAQQLLFRTPKNELPEMNFSEYLRDSPSFGMADGSITSAEIQCGWMTFSEYAEKTGIEISMVEREAKEGKYGPILTHPATGAEVVVWPPEMQSKPLNELPKPGRYKVKVKSRLDSAMYSIPIASPDNYEQLQKIYMSLAHDLGSLDELAVRSEEMLNQSCFVLHWTAFEFFLRSTIQELIKLHPTKIASGSKGKKFSLTYEEILSATNDFSSIESLRDDIIQREIQRLESGDESVHGLINFLKKEFRFEKDPYDIWYVLNGKWCKGHYKDLIELKDVRNSMMHDSGRPGNSFFEKYPNVPKRDGAIVIDDDYYTKALLIFKSIAFTIAKSISEGKYRAEASE